MCAVILRKRPWQQNVIPPLCAIKESAVKSLVDDLIVYLQQQTYRWCRFSSFCSADKSEILGLVSAERGWSVLCYHRYVVGRCCGGQQKTLIYKKCSSVHGFLNSNLDFFSAFQKLFCDEIASLGYTYIRGNTDSHVRIQELK